MGVGRLKESVVRVGGAPKISDPELADREWAASTDPTRAPVAAGARSPAASQGQRPAADDLVLADELAREKHFKANLAELDYRERLGELVEAKDMAKKLADVFTLCRARLLVVPVRARQALPHLTVADVGEIEKIIREALEELANLGAEAAAEELAAEAQG